MNTITDISIPKDTGALEILAVNMLQVFIAGAFKENDSQEVIDDIQDQGVSQREDGLCVSASIHHDAGASSSGEHREAVCLEGEGVGLRLDYREDQSSGWGSWYIWNSNGKLNKTKKGKLRFPLPVGLYHDDESNIVLDPDEEVRKVISMLFTTRQPTIRNTIHII